MEIIDDTYIEIKCYPITKDEDIFKIILAQRKNNLDQKRFFIDYIQQEELSKYDFNNKDSIKSFRRICATIDSPLIRMGGYNMDPIYLNDDIRYAGIKMSDPSEKILGSFDIRNGIITYSPIFPHFYKERDISKFAHDSYYTTMTFEEIMLNQIDNAIDYYVHIGNYHELKDIREKEKYILEKVSKDQMIEFITNPESGLKVLKRKLNY